MTAPRRVHLLQLLSDLQHELQQMGCWEQSAPTAQALQSQQPFCVDTLEFTQWLQWLFIPRMQALIHSEQALPSQCAICEMAEMVYREQRVRVDSLLRCLKSIDVAITEPYQVH